MGNHWLITGVDNNRIRLVIKNERLAKIIKATFRAQQKQKHVQFVQEFFAVLNAFLSFGAGLHFAIGGSLDSKQIILIVFPSTVSGFLMLLASKYPLLTILIPLAIWGIENLPDPFKKYRIFGKAAEEYHNEQPALLIYYLLKMRRLSSNFCLLKYLCSASNRNFHYYNVSR